MPKSKGGIGWRLVVVAALTLLPFLFAGCAVKQPVDLPFVEPPPPPPPPPPKAEPKIEYGKPYKVHGKSYCPIVAADEFKEKGIASWYGDDFHKKRTASGDRFDMFKVSAAHKLLPMYTWVKVTNLANGQNIVLQVNDRGPFITGRIIDLSYGAASLIGMEQGGVARVLVESLGPVPSPGADELAGSFYVQIGSFQKSSNAHRLHAQVVSAQSVSGMRTGARIVKVCRTDPVFWRVQVGEFPTLAEARKAQASLKVKYPKAFIVAAKPAPTTRQTLAQGGQGDNSMRAENHDESSAVVEEEVSALDLGENVSEIDVPTMRGETGDDEGGAEDISAGESPEIPLRLEAWVRVSPVAAG